MSGDRRRLGLRRGDYLQRQAVDRYDQPVTVNYATADGTGVAGVDYVTTFGTLTFAPGETDKTITVELLGATAPRRARTSS